MIQKVPWCSAEYGQGRGKLHGSLASPEYVAMVQLRAEENLNAGRVVGRLLVVGDEDRVDSRII